MVEESSLSENIKLNLILDAAQKRFAHYGYAKTTMTEIASDVGLSKASLYYYFTDKDNLFQAVVKREQDLFIEAMKKMILVNNTAQNKLTSYVQNRHEYFLKTLTNLEKIKISIDTLKPLFATLLEGFFVSEVKLVSEIMQEGIAKSEFESIDVPLHADLFIAVMNGIRYITIKNKDSYMLEQNDYDQVKNRITNLSAVFIKGILKR